MFRVSIFIQRKMSNCLYVSKAWNHLLIWPLPSCPPALLEHEGVGGHCRWLQLLWDKLLCGVRQELQAISRSFFISISVTIILTCVRVCVCMSFVLSILCFSACVGSVALAKSRTEKIDRGYRFKTCNSSSLDKSISDTTSITSSYTFTWIFVFHPWWNLWCDMCVCVSMCGEERGGLWGLHLIAEGDWQCGIGQYLSTTELRKIGLSLMTFSSIETCTAPLPAEND